MYSPSREARELLDRISSRETHELVGRPSTSFTFTFENLVEACIAERQNRAKLQPHTSRFSPIIYQDSHFRSQDPIIRTRGDDLTIPSAGELRTYFFGEEETPSVTAPPVLRTVARVLDPVLNAIFVRPFFRIPGAVPEKSPVHEVKRLEKEIEERTAVRMGDGVARVLADHMSAERAFEGTTPSGEATTARTLRVVRDEKEKEQQELIALHKRYAWVSFPLKTITDPFALEEVSDYLSYAKIRSAVSDHLGDVAVAGTTPYEVQRLFENLPQEEQDAVIVKDSVLTEAAFVFEPFGDGSGNFSDKAKIKFKIRGDWKEHEETVDIDDYNTFVRLSHYGLSTLRARGVPVPKEETVVAALEHKFGWSLRDADYVTLRKEARAADDGFRAPNEGGNNVFAHFSFDNFSGTSHIVALDYKTGLGGTVAPVDKADFSSPRVHAQALDRFATSIIRDVFLPEVKKDPRYAALVDNLEVVDGSYLVPDAARNRVTTEQLFLLDELQEKADAIAIQFFEGGEANRQTLLGENALDGQDLYTKIRIESLNDCLGLPVVSKERVVTASGVTLDPSEDIKSQIVEGWLKPLLFEVHDPTGLGDTTQVEKFMSDVADGLVRQVDRYIATDRRVVDSAIASLSDLCMVAPEPGKDFFVSYFNSLDRVMYDRLDKDKMAEGYGCIASKEFKEAHTELKKYVALEKKYRETESRPMRWLRARGLRKAREKLMSAFEECDKLANKTYLSLVAQKEGMISSLGEMGGLSTMYVSVDAGGALSCSYQKNIVSSPEEKDGPSTGPAPIDTSIALSTQAKE